MVSKQVRINFRVKDIIAVRIKCKECYGEVVNRIDADNLVQWPQRCPWCKEPIAGYEYIQDFLSTLRTQFDNVDNVTFELETE